MCFILNDEGGKRIADNLRSFFEPWPRRHYKTACRGLLPSRKTEHSHDPVDRGRVLSDECQFIDNSKEHRRGVSINITVHYQEWELGAFRFNVPSTLFVEAKNTNFIFGSGRDFP